MQSETGPRCNSKLNPYHPANTKYLLNFFLRSQTTICEMSMSLYLCVDVTAHTTQPAIWFTTPPTALFKATAFSRVKKSTMH